MAALGEHPAVPFIKLYEGLLNNSIICDDGDACPSTTHSSPQGSMDGH